MYGPGPFMFYQDHLCFGISGLSRRSWSPSASGPPGPSTAILLAVDGPPGPVMAATDGPPLPQVVPQYISILYTIFRVKLTVIGS